MRDISVIEHIISQRTTKIRDANVNVSQDSWEI